MTIPSFIPRDLLPLGLLVALTACGGDEAAPAEDRAAAEPAAAQPGTEAPAPGPTLTVNITAPDGTEHGPYTMAVDGLRSSPDIDHLPNGPYIVMISRADESRISGVMLGLSTDGPGEVAVGTYAYDPQTLTLRFVVDAGPDDEMVSGEYESSSGTATLTVVSDERLAGSFEGTFVHQKHDREYQVSGSFDIREDG